MKPAILIHGPTASGKTQLSIEVARKLNGEIVNADSMQVYRELKVISARPDEAEMDGIPHHLFGHVSSDERFSTGQWLEQVRPVIEDIQKREKTAVVVGGTGLYLLALTEGLSDIPPVPEDVRHEVLEIHKADGVRGLKIRLQSVDPEAARRIDDNDRQRLMRAYEVWLSTGKPLSSFQSNRSKPVLNDNEWISVALTPPRSRLYARIDRRFEGMLMEGAMEEARELVRLDIDPELPAMKAHGMPWLSAFIRGDINSALAAENAKRDTRRYAKRQFTWIGRQFPFWPRIPSEELNTRMRVVSALYKEVDR